MAKFAGKTREEKNLENDTIAAKLLVLAVNELSFIFCNQKLDFPLLSQ